MHANWIDVCPPLLAQAIRDVFEDTRALLEPAGAISIAGELTGRPRFAAVLTFDSTTGLSKWKEAKDPEAQDGSFGGSYVAIASDACNIEFDFLKVRACIAYILSEQESKHYSQRRLAIIFAFVAGVRIDG